MSRPARLLLAAIAAFAAAAALAACGSSSATSSSSSDRSTTTEGTAAPDVNPCELFSKADMAVQMGADDVTAETVDGVSPTCVYASEAHRLKAELAVLDADQIANTPRDPTAYLTDEAKGSLEVLDVKGIGDEVFGSRSKGGVTLVVRTGTTGYSLALTNAGGGPDAGNWSEEDAMVASAQAILSSVAGS